MSAHPELGDVPYAPVSVQNVLAHAAEADLKEVLVIGLGTDGTPTFFCSTSDKGAMLLMMEWCRFDLIKPPGLDLE